MVAEANEVVAAVQAGVTAMVNCVGVPSPTGKCKFRARQGSGGNSTSGEKTETHLV
jgi:hypothetical protein